MKRFAGLVLGLTLAGGVAAQDEDDAGLRHLWFYNGCAPMHTWVEFTLRDGFDLSKARIETLAKSRLSAAGLYDGSEPHALFVEVIVARVGGAQRRWGWAYRHDLYFYRWLAGYGGPAITWRTGGIGVVSPDTAESALYSTLSEDIDAFILDYLQVNEDACE